MTNKIHCLDHGYIKLKNISSTTRRIVDEENNYCTFDASDIDPAISARVSFNNLNESRTRKQDLKLYEYLIANQHTTPIEMIETWWEMKLPIFVARQFVRTRTATINEVSARYATLDTDWYIPDNVGGKADNVKQGQEDNLSDETKEAFKDSLNTQCKSSYHLYLSYLSKGVAPEHARLVLHVNHYTTWVMKIDLHNLMRFLSLRLDDHAQIEARVYAQAIYDSLVPFLPKSMEYFDTYIRKPSKEELYLLSKAFKDIEAMYVYDKDEEVEKIYNTTRKFFKRLGVK